MSSISVHKSPLADLLIIKRQPIGDPRGYLERLFCRKSLEPFLRNKEIRQINHTLTQKEGTVRGFHFQHPPHAEIKIVSCIKGEVLDIAIDLRADSPTFLQHHAVVLSETNFQSFLIPEGFAHGFQTLTVNCEMLYFHTADYNTDAEGALNALDPHLGIAWPLPISERSFRDENHPMIQNDFSGLKL
jgi:dTDP-4-dehydrorhamnose 3,5-epimerase